MEYTLLAPAGSNFNYIAQVLTDEQEAWDKFYG